MRYQKMNMARNATKAILIPRNGRSLRHTSLKRMVPAGNERSISVKCSMRSSIVCEADVNSACCQKSFHPGIMSSITIIPGVMTEHGSVSLRSCGEKYALLLDVTQNQVSRVSIARVSKPPNAAEKKVSIRTNWSKDANARSLWIRSVYCSPLLSVRRQLPMMMPQPNYYGNMEDSFHV